MNANIYRQLLSKFKGNNSVCISWGRGCTPSCENHCIELLRWSKKFDLKHSYILKMFQSLLLLSLFLELHLHCLFVCFLLTFHALGELSWDAMSCINNAVVIWSDYCETLAFGWVDFLKVGDAAGSCIIAHHSVNSSYRNTFAKNIKLAMSELAFKEPEIEYQYLFLLYSWAFAYPPISKDDKNRSCMFM